MLQFVSGTTASDLVTAVNRLGDQLGVRAEFINSANANSGVQLVSTGWGSRSFVAINARGGSFDTTDVDGNARARTEGRDAVATINGALVEGEGLNLRLNTTNLDLELTLDEDFGDASTEFAITGGGSLFQLGPQVKSLQQVNLGVQSVAASKLGDLTVGFLSDVQKGGPASLEKDPAAASAIIEKAIRQVSVMRGRLGAFEKNTLETNINSLSVALENVTAAESTIRDADFAYETAQLTRAQILTQAGTSVLATANSTPQSVLSLLQG